MFATLLSCGNDDITIMEDVNMRCWREDAIIEFNNNAPSRYDIDIVLHVNGNYTSSSCKMIISTITPDSMHTSELVTIETPIKKKASQAQAQDIVIPYRHNVSMSKRGLYCFRIRPSSPLEGVEAAGMTFKHQR